MRLIAAIKRVTDPQRQTSNFYTSDSNHQAAAFAEDEA